ncbi:MAG: hypothetical protein ACQGQP_09040, partial [Desulfovibrio sp.]
TLRKTISLTFCLSLLFLSSLVLYARPVGGIAGWSGWTCLPDTSARIGSPANAASIIEPPANAVAMI